jgi:hypothetical protein
VRVANWVEAEDARREIVESAARYKEEAAARQEVTDRSVRRVARRLRAVPTIGAPRRGRDPTLSLPATYWARAFRARRWRARLPTRSSSRSTIAARRWDSRAS